MQFSLKAHFTKLVLLLANLSLQFIYFIKKYIYSWYLNKIEANIIEWYDNRFEQTAIMDVDGVYKFR